MKLNECGFSDTEIENIKYVCGLFKAQKVTVMDKVKIGDFPCMTIGHREQKQS